MKSEEFLNCLGKPSSAPEIKKMLTALGVKEKLEIPEDDIECRFNIEEKGLSLVFKTDRSHPSHLAFAAIQFLQPYSDPIPRNIKFSNGAEDLKKTLGNPTESKKQLRLDRWKSKDLVLTVEYNKQGKVDCVTFHISAYY